MFNKKINQLKVWDNVDNMAVLIENYTAKTDRNGYIVNTFMFSDTTGRIPGVLWGEPLPIQVGDIAFVSGIVGYYEGPQIQVEAISIVPPEEVENFIDAVMPASKFSERELRDKISILLNKIPDDNIREFTKKVIEETPNFFRAPAGKRVHHAWIGGLAEHSIAVAEIVEKTMYRYNVSPSIAIAGGLLHDIGKTKELVITGGINYSDIGRLQSHMFIGAQILSQANHSNHLLDQNVLNDLIHIVLSHHGQLEHGAVVKPATLEALLVHLADRLDGTMEAAEELVRKDNNSHSNWTAYDHLLQMSMRKK